MAWFVMVIRDPGLVVGYGYSQHLARVQTGVV